MHNATTPTPCTFLHLNEELLESTKEHLPSEKTLKSIAELFFIFSDATRIRILCVLLARELCVCDIAKLLNMSVSAISHQLRLLRGASLIRARKSGKAVFYSLADEHVRTILDCGLEHVCE